MLIFPKRISIRRTGNVENPENADRELAPILLVSGTIWCHISRATYGSLLNDGFRTTSKFMKPATPSASPTPCPPVSCTSHKTSVVGVNRNPVYNLSTRDDASCPTADKLCGPSYRERNFECHCVTMFACPDSHTRSVSKCGSIVGIGSS